MIWIVLLIRWGINVLALIVVDWMFGGVTIGRWGSLLLGGARPHDRQHDPQADPRDPHAAAHHRHVRARVLRDQRAHARARGVDRAGLLDRRLLDVRRRDDRRLARERHGRLVARQVARLIAVRRRTSCWLFVHISAAIAGSVARSPRRSSGPREALRDPLERGVGQDWRSWAEGLLPASLVVLVTGALAEDGNWDWSEPFVCSDRRLAIVASRVRLLTSDGPVGRAWRGAEPGARRRGDRLVLLARVLILVLFAIVFVMVVKPGT